MDRLVYFLMGAEEIFYGEGGLGRHPSPMGSGTELQRTRLSTGSPSYLKGCRDCDCGLFQEDFDVAF